MRHSGSELIPTILLLSLAQMQCGVPARRMSDVVNIVLERATGKRAVQLPSRPTLNNILAEAGIIAEAHLHEHTRGRSGTTLGHDGSEYSKVSFSPEFHTTDRVLSAGPTHIPDGTALVQGEEAARRMAEIKESGRTLTAPHTMAPLTHHHRCLGHGCCGAKEEVEWYRPSTGAATAAGSHSASGHATQERMEQQTNDQSLA
jgi:hypothetical protein